MSNNIRQLPYALRQPGVSRATIDRWLAFVNDPTDPRHGTQNGYSNRGCRCDRCRAANVETMRRARERRASHVPEHRHGQYTTYTNYGCRCAPCTEANRLNHLKQRTARGQTNA